MEDFEQGCADLKEQLEQIESLSVKRLKPSDTVLIISDMIKGFTAFGPLSSQRVGLLSDPILGLAKTLDQSGFEIVAFADAHSKESPEFNSFPVHCLAGSKEAELIDGLDLLEHLHIIHKNSTNGYLEPEFQRLLKMNPDWRQFIIVGNCTDVCVMQFALTLKAHFNRMDLVVDVFVPVDYVNTYDGPGHDGDFMHQFALLVMRQNGIRLIKLED